MGARLSIFRAGGYTQKPTRAVATSEEDGGGCAQRRRSTRSPTLGPSADHNTSFMPPETELMHQNAAQSTFASGWLNPVAAGSKLCAPGARERAGAVKRPSSEPCISLDVAAETASAPALHSKVVQSAES
mmetsp:Transcript_11592/g.38133  ORF Transcript_11592/g.38133 Transcript_11592/m.38133 type:complete len:130 (+) Transcript_11592:219-608(+)